MPLRERWADMKWLAPHRTLRVQRINLSHTVPEVVPAEVFAQAKAAFKDRVGGEIAVPLGTRRSTETSPNRIARSASSIPITDGAFTIERGCHKVVWLPLVGPEPALVVDPESF
jgi:hypothetical protein